jgi:hypothetical protein
MSDDLNKLAAKQDQIAEDITEIKVVLGRQEVHLSEHIRRTAAAEENIAILRQELKPVEDHVKFMQGAIKLLGVVALVLSAIVSALKIFAVF